MMLVTWCWSHVTDHFREARSERCVSPWCSLNFYSFILHFFKLNNPELSKQPDGPEEGEREEVKPRPLSFHILFRGCRKEVEENGKQRRLTGGELILSAVVRWRSLTKDVSDVITECLWEIKLVRTLLITTLSIWSNSVKKIVESFDQSGFFHC